MAIPGRCKARFAERFVNEPGKVMAECALVTVSECVDFRIIDGLYWIAVQFLETGLHAAFFGFFLSFLQLLFLELRNDRFAFVRSFDIYARHVEITARET